MTACTAPSSRLHGGLHHFAVGVARAGRFAHPGAEFANFRARRAEDDGPVDLVGVAIAERFAEPRRGARMAREHEAAGGVAVEAMHELRAFLGVELQAIEHAVDVARGVGAALHGEAGGLVEHDDVVVACG